MDATNPKSRFAEFNLDPALAETVQSASPLEIIEGILRLDDPRQIPPKFTVVSQFIRICTGRFFASDTWTIRLHPNVVSLKAAQPMGTHDCCQHLSPTEDSEEVPQRAVPRTLPFTGRGCIVAALDFGLDFTHPNFLNPDGTTRVIAFWNQVAPYDPAHPNRYGYGRVFSPNDINRALNASDPFQALGYHPAISDTGQGSHGTHTLDIAAGNGRAPGATPGIAPDADLLFVHLSTPSPGPTGDLGDSVRMLEALDFVHSTAQDRPWVVNLSVGRTAGSHDGTSPFEQGMHEILRIGSGRAIVQSAGNYRAADLAVEGWLRDGEKRDMEWIIDPRDTTPNEIDVWYSGNDRFLVALQPPEGGNFVEVRLGQVADISHDGALVGRIYHRKNDPNNRDNHIAVFLYPNAPSGVWTLRLIGEYVIKGRFHAWIERSLARPGAQSRFDPKITTQSYTLGTIATSPLVITVGAYDAHTEGAPLAYFSSCGPTRDDRHEKPELLAPGVNVVAARSMPRGAARQEGRLIARSGTSMATPHVAGCVATMFEAAGLPVSIVQIRNCLQQAAEPVTDGDNTDCSAWGRLNIAAAIDRARDLGAPDPLSNTQLDKFDSDNSPTVGWTAVSDAITEEIADAPDGPGAQRPTDTIRIPAFDPDRLLERAEQTIRKYISAGRQSEVGFLQQLFRELDTRVFLPTLSPAALFRALAKDSSATFGSGDSFTIVALPSAQPEDPLRRGDWMLRATPGTGDIGHISILASDELLPRSALAPNGIAAEGQQPGYYGVVVEAGAFPHTRSCQFARRFLDSRGRAPLNTLILRPKYAGVAVIESEPAEDDTSQQTIALPVQPSRCTGVMTFYERPTYQLFLNDVKKVIRTCVQEGRENELLDNNDSLVSAWNELQLQPISMALGEPRKILVVPQYDWERTSGPPYWRTTRITFLVQRKKTPAPAIPQFDVPDDRKDKPKPSIPPPKPPCPEGKDCKPSPPTPQQFDTWYYCTDSGVKFIKVPKGQKPAAQADALTGFYQSNVAARLECFKHQKNIIDPPPGGGSGSGIGDALHALKSVLPLFFLFGSVAMFGEADFLMESMIEVFELAEELKALYPGEKFLFELNKDLKQNRLSVNVIRNGVSQDLQTFIDNLRKSGTIGQYEHDHLTSLANDVIVKMQNLDGARSLGFARQRGTWVRGQFIEDIYIQEKLRTQGYVGLPDWFKGYDAYREGARFDPPEWKAGKYVTTFYDPDLISIKSYEPKGGLKNIDLDYLDGQMDKWIENMKDNVFEKDKVKIVLSSRKKQAAARKNEIHLVLLGEEVEPQFRDKLQGIAQRAASKGVSLKVIQYVRSLSRFTSLP